MLGLFEGQLEKMVALAVLAPIVASQGGNATTQTMTVAVRALATRELTDANAWRVIVRELLVGLLNGLAFAVITGVAAWAWFKVPGLGIVIGLAMICNLVAAALGGILIPLGAQPAAGRPGGGVEPVRHHGDRCGRLLLLPGHRDVLVRPEMTLFPAVNHAGLGLPRGRVTFARVAFVWRPSRQPGLVGGDGGGVRPPRLVATLAPVRCRCAVMTFFWRWSRRRSSCAAFGYGITQRNDGRLMAERYAALQVALDDISRSVRGCRSFRRGPDKALARRTGLKDLRFEAEPVGRRPRSAVAARPRRPHHRLVQLGAGPRADQALAMFGLWGLAGAVAVALAFVAVLLARLAARRARTLAGSEEAVRRLTTEDS